MRSEIQQTFRQREREHYPPPRKLNFRLLFLSFIFFVFASVFAPAAYAADGNLTQDTSDGYYLIEDADDLAVFRDGVNKGEYTSSNARLTANIDLSEYGNWTPIGNYSTPYTGTFDGGGFSISNLVINNTSDDYVGLFGYVDSEGVVKNLTIANGNVNGGSSKDGIVGIVASNSGTVQNCINLGDVSGLANVGGVVAANYNGAVQNCAWLSDTASNGVGNNSDHTGVTEINDTSNIVMTLFASIDTQSVYTGETAAITFSTSPASPDGVFDSTSGALRSDGVVIDCDTSVATAVYNNDGTITVTGLSEGETTITVNATFYATDFSTLDNDPPSYLTTGTELTFTFNLTVSNIALESISIPETAEVQVGKTTTLAVIYTPEDATNQKLTWASSDESVATVDENGNVTGVSAGQATITATPDDTNAAAQTCTVTVTDEPESETKSGSSGGGCNAGIGALALLALIPLALRRKR